jgi:hypothetical protein
MTQSPQINHMLATHHHSDHAGGMVGVTKDFMDNVPNNSYLDRNFSYNNWAGKIKGGWTNHNGGRGDGGSADGGSSGNASPRGLGGSHYDSKHSDDAPPAKMRRISSSSRDSTIGSQPAGFRMVNHIGYGDVEKTRDWIVKLNELGVNVTMDEWRLWREVI